MTDDAEQYHNAWVEVFGESNTRKILCAWHVDRVWRKALLQHIGERENQVRIYHQLRLLLTKTEESQFRVILQLIQKSIIKNFTTISISIIAKG